MSDFDFSGIQKFIDLVLGEEPITEAHGDALGDALGKLPDAALEIGIQRLSSCTKTSDETDLRVRNRLSHLNRMAAAHPSFNEAMQRLHASRLHASRLHASHIVAASTLQPTSVVLSPHLVKVVDAQGRQQHFVTHADPYVALAQYVVRGYATKEAAKSAQICPIEGLKPVDKVHLAEVLAWEHLVAEAIECGPGWIRENFLEKDPDKCSKLLAEVQARMVHLPRDGDAAEEPGAYGG